MYARDPVSVMFDQAAAAVLRRARSARGAWYGTRIADATDRQRAALLAAHGIDPEERDRVPGGAARTRWARGFTRAVYYHARAGGRPVSVQVQIGRRVPARGVIPAGRVVRVRTRPGGQAARRAVQRLPAAERVFTSSGRPGPRWASPDNRDWSSTDG